MDGLLAKLARPAPATTSFVEARFSKLLDQPLVAKGQLEYLEDGTLVRIVDTPFRERSEIRADTVSVQREGKPPRRFSLKRAPELRSMLGGFAAVLGGSRSSHLEDFTLALQGAAETWQLSLTPGSSQVSRYVRDIVIHGAGSDPRCIIVTQPDDQSSVMLLGQAAETTLPSPLDRGWLQRFCDGTAS